VLMLTESQFSLGSGASFNLPLIEGTGATYRLEAQQEPGYPYGGVPSVSIEGCGGLTPGMVTLFPTENSNPAIAQYCRESTAAYDPNDKQGWPKGVGDDHFIKSNTAIDYMIRFQNTGTDTAFTVVLVDTLPLTLNPKSVRMGAASHPYTFELASDNILRIRFDNILLPHEAINEAGSQGFVQFNIQQQPDHTDGTVIENSAAIYFDFNAPIITNTTRHTIGSLFLGSVATNEQAAHLPQLKVFPNPTSDVLFFESKTWKASDLLFTLSDAQGRTVVQRDQVSLPMTLQRGALQNGVYFFQFNTRDGQPLWTGKVLVK
jgi:uncharacterized repeat protein (TIGR01451 family)